MSVQVRRRRETAAFLSTFVGAPGELLVDTTNNRVQVHDGTTPGGWPAAKLSEVTQLGANGALPVAQGGTGGKTGADARAALGAAAAGANSDVTSLSGLTTPLSIAQGGTGVALGRTAIADAAYTATAGDRTLAYTSLTAARIVTLPAAAAFSAGTQLLVVDESGGCGATNTITVAAAGSDTINGAAAAVLALPYGFLALVGNGAARWTVVDQSTASMAQQTASSVAIAGGAINGATVGATAASTGRFTTLVTTSTTTLGGVLGLKTYTVATLPAPAVAGRAAYCTNARVFNGAGTLEAAGSGSGGLVTDNGTAWRLAGTNVVASA